MTTEKDSIRFILERRGIINNGKFDEVRFQKLVTEPWIRTKTIKYGFDKLNETVDQEVLDAVNDSLQVTVLPNEMIDTPVKESEYIETETETETETEEPVVEPEKVAVEQTEEVAEEVVPAVEEPLVEPEEVAVEQTEEVVPEVVEETTPKKKTTKKK